MTTGSFHSFGTRIVLQRSLPVESRFVGYPLFSFMCNKINSQYFVGRLLYSYILRMLYSFAPGISYKYGVTMSNAVFHVCYFWVVELFEISERQYRTLCKHITETCTYWRYICIRMYVGSWNASISLWKN